MSYEILLPPTFDQQEKLSNLLWNIENLKESYSYLKYDLRNLLFSLIKDLFTKNYKKEEIKKCIIKNKYQKIKSGHPTYIEIGDIDLFDKSIIRKDKKSVVRRT